MDRGRWDNPGYRQEWDISQPLTSGSRFYQSSLRHWLDLGLANKKGGRQSPPSFTFTTKILKKAKLPKKKLPLIEKKTTAAVKQRPKIYSFASKRRNSYSSPLTAFGSASMTKKLPSMQFKRIIPAHVYKSRHATKEQIAIQARLRRSLSRQKIRKFKQKLRRVFEEKAALAIQSAFRQNRARNILIQKRVLLVMFQSGVDAVTKLQTMWRYKTHMRHEMEQRLSMDHLSRLMAMYDEDGSGTIDRDELKALLQDLNQPCSDLIVDEWFSKMDKDDSGEIDVVELYHQFPSTLAATMRSQGLFKDENEDQEEEPDTSGGVMRLRLQSLGNTSPSSRRFAAWGQE